MPLKPFSKKMFCCKSLKLAEAIASHKLKRKAGLSLGAPGCIWSKGQSHLPAGTQSLCPETWATLGFETNFPPPSAGRWGLPGFQDDTDQGLDALFVSLFK